MSQIRGVSRVDQPHKRMAGWVARAGFVRTARGYRPAFIQYFSDAAHGGKKKALATAGRWVARKRREAAQLKPKQRQQLVRARAA